MPDPKGPATSREVTPATVAMLLKRHVHEETKKAILHEKLKSGDGTITKRRGSNASERPSTASTARCSSVSGGSSIDATPAVTNRPHSPRSPRPEAKKSPKVSPKPRSRGSTPTRRAYIATEDESGGNTKEFLVLAPSSSSKAAAAAKAARSAGQRPPKATSSSAGGACAGAALPTTTASEAGGAAAAEAEPAFIGARWQRLAPSRPTGGRELENPALASALATDQLNFTEDEMGSIGLLNELRQDDFIKAGAYYYKPSDRKPSAVGSKLGAIVNAKGIAARLAAAERKKVREQEKAAEASAWLSEWSKWLAAIDLPRLILDALGMPREGGEAAAFEYMKGLSRPRVVELLEGARLGGLADVLLEGLDKLHAQSAPSGNALNDKFQVSGKFTMGYGGLDVFFGGLEQLLGPPQMVKDPENPEAGATLLMGMQSEHVSGKDADEDFTSSNGVTTTSSVEWQFAYAPDAAEVYPEREGFREAHPAWCRAAKPMGELMELLETHVNGRLRKEGHNELIFEEVLAGRLYTGPMYQKYNAVLRACTKDPYLVECARKICRNNSYVTTIHAINSAVIKMSKLSKAGKVYRGVCYGKLPPQFWKADESGVKGGIEFGFQSTTRERKQAVHYAQGGGWAKSGDAMTVMEFQMGMIDRGADLSWLSQYPHEKEVLLPPLTGIEALGTDVEGDMLVVHSRLSLNLSAQTLEQVLSRRRKMLMDMAGGIELEIRDALAKTEHLISPALAVLRNALKYSALAQSPEFYNNDDNFAKVMNVCLYLQRTIIAEIGKLYAAMDKPDLSLKGWKASGPARVTLLAGWMLTRTSCRDVAIDLQQAELSPEDGAELAELMRRTPKLTSLDVRGNESLGEAGASALINWLKADKASGTHTLRSLNGVCPAHSAIHVPRHAIAPVELAILCAELEVNIFAEGVSAGMGGKGGAGGASLNRRGHAGVGEWQPLIWAAKDNNLLVATKLMDTGTDVNLAEPADDKSGSCYTALHWAALRGFTSMAALLLKRRANMHVLDKHGNTPLALAEKKGNKEIIALLKPKAPWNDDD